MFFFFIYIYIYIYYDDDVDGGEIVSQILLLGKQKSYPVRF